MASLRLNSPEFRAFPTVALDFANHKKSIEGRSEQTVCEYLVDLRIFFRYLRAVERDIPFSSPEFSEIEIMDITVADMEKVTAVLKKPVTWAWLLIVAAASLVVSLVVSAFKK
jgi:hypothetical protein